MMFSINIFTALRIVRRLRSNLYKSMLLQEVGWFDTKGTGELVNRLSNDTYFVGVSLSQNFSDGLRALAMIVVGSGMMVCFTSFTLMPFSFQYQIIKDRSQFYTLVGL